MDMLHDELLTYFFIEYIKILKNLALPAIFLYNVEFKSQHLDQIFPSYLLANVFCQLHLEMILLFILSRELITLVLRKTLGDFELSTIIPNWFSLYLYSGTITSDHNF